MEEFLQAPVSKLVVVIIEIVVDIMAHLDSFPVLLRDIVMVRISISSLLSLA